MKFMYKLPQERIKTQGNALAMGCLAALRDYPKTLDHDAVKVQARVGCVTLKQSFASPRRQLTNNFGLFCELFIEQYVACYLENAQGYIEDEAFYEKNKTKADEIGWEVAYHLLVEDYTAQLEGKS